MAKFEQFLAESGKIKSLSQALDEWNDIMGSGQGGAFTAWHRRELMALVTRLDPKLKEMIWDELYSDENIEELDIPAAEVKFAREILTK